jgi:hypothetical protein
MAASDAEAMRLGLSRVRIAAIVVVLLLVGVLIIAWPRISLFLAVDRCLDKGGCWDAERNDCEFHDQSRCKPLP